MPFDAIQNSPSEHDTASSATKDPSDVDLSRTMFFPDILRDRKLKRSRVISEAAQLFTPVAGTSSIQRAEVSKENLGIVRRSVALRDIPREVKLQEWEGQVDEVRRNYFSARLVDLTAGQTEESEEVDLPIDDLAEGDRALLVPGALFRWIIGYRYSHGQKERFARVVIRRLPMWTEEEMKAADREAAEMHDALFGSGKNRTPKRNAD